MNSMSYKQKKTNGKPKKRNENETQILIDREKNDQKKRAWNGNVT